MSILSVAQDVSNYIAIDKPTSFLGSTDRELVELASIANRAADYITALHDWQTLTVRHTLTGGGVTTEFSLPSDFLKFTDNAKGEAEIVTPIMAGPMCRVQDPNEWLNREVRLIGLVTYSWIRLGDAIHIKPALPAGVSAYFHYQSKLHVAEESPSTVKKAEFQQDGDRYRLDERMLKECIKWMWRHSKGQSYAEYMAGFERRKAQCISWDIGPRALSFGRSGSKNIAPYAYPFEIG